MDDGPCFFVEDLVTLRRRGRRQQRQSVGVVMRTWRGDDDDESDSENDLADGECIVHWCVFRRLALRCVRSPPPLLRFAAGFVVASQRRSNAAFSRVCAPCRVVGRSCSGDARFRAARNTAFCAAVVVRLTATHAGSTTAMPIRSATFGTATTSCSSIASSWSATFCSAPTGLAAKARLAAVRRRSLRATLSPPFTAGVCRRCVALCVFQKPHTPVLVSRSGRCANARRRRVG